jgi:APA family basic amino acid/polyamine antiporter
MENKLQKRYGLITAIAMVVGIVIGSGVFFKAEAVLSATGGNVPVGIAAWAIVGVIMIICSYCFATMANRYERMNGIVDYADATLGEGYGYFVGWFMATIYYPTLTSVLAWVSARYTCVLLGWDITGGSCMTIAAFFLCASYAVNALSPRIAGKLQVSTTIIKLIPLALMAIVGTIAGLASGMVGENFSRVVDTTVSTSSGLMASVVAVAFAYEGWIIATSINAELKDAKRNLPLALLIGALIVVVVYILYYVGLTGAVTTETLMAGGQAAAKLAFQNLFGTAAGTIIFVLVVVSCLDTLNGLMLGCCRGMYTLAVRRRGPLPDMYEKVDPYTNIPANSSIIGLFFCGLWLFFFYGANLSTNWFGLFSFDSSELPIVTIYAMYIPIFVMLMAKERQLGAFKRIITPALAIAGCLFMVYAAVIAHGMKVAYYLVIFAAFMAVGMCFYKQKAK